VVFQDVAPKEVDFRRKGISCCCGSRINIINCYSDDIPGAFWGIHHAFLIIHDVLVMSVENSELTVIRNAQPHIVESVNQAFFLVSS